MPFLRHLGKTWRQSSQLGRGAITASTCEWLEREGIAVLMVGLFRFALLPHAEPESFEAHMRDEVFDGSALQLTPTARIRAPSTSGK